MPTAAPVPPDIPGDVLSVTQRFTFVGQVCQFSWYFRYGVLVPSHADSVINVAACNRAWLASVALSFQTIVSVGTTLLDSRCYSLRWPDVATDILSSGGLVGLRAGDPLPPQICQVMSKRTAVRGRAGRGRVYLGGMSETDSTNGEPNAAYIVLANAFATAANAPIVDGVSGRTFVGVVVSKVNSGKILPVPVAGPFYHVSGSDIIHITADDIWYTQRRRTFGHGQ